MGKAIGLDVPARVQPGKDAFNIRPRKLAIWVNALPRANLGETARQIYAVLNSTNQLSYPYQDRIRFLETLREPVEYVTKSMKKHFVGINLPLPEKNQKIAMVTRELFLSMATAYKIAIEDKLTHSLFYSDRSTLSLLIHRCISYIGLAQLTSYQTYAPISEKCWADLNKLYLYAENRRLLKTKVSDYQHVYVNKTTLATEYARLQLLALCSPFHLRQGEVNKVYDSLERWISHSPIDKLTLQNKEQAHYVVNFAENAPPQILSQIITKQFVDSNQIRVIDTKQIASKLEAELQKEENVAMTTLTGLDMSRPNLSHDLLKRLLIAWDLVSKRHFPRKSKEEQVKVTIGLNSAHQFISQRAQNHTISNKHKDIYSQRAHFESTDIRLPDQNHTETSDDVWGMVYPSALTGLEPLVEKELSLQQAEGEEPAENYQADNWAILNESARGLMLQSEQECKNKAQVGELISISRKLNGRSWRWGIGVIRWIKFSQDKQMQMGIEILNPNAAAVGIRAGSSEISAIQRTLMLPELKNIKEPASLITSPVPWRVGNKIVINMLGKDVQATLTKSVQNTGLFAQFQFEIENAQKPPELDSTAPKEQEFNNIWSTI